MNDLPTTTDDAAETLPGAAVAQVVLRPRKSQPFFGRHPWVLESAIARVEGPASDGDVVDLVSDKGKFIARGLYNGRSRLRVRLYTWDAAERLDDSFFHERLARAVRFRADLGLTKQAEAARLVFSEADGLSGLIVDRYGQYLVIQATSLAVWKRLDSIAASLQSIVSPRGIVLRYEQGATKLEGFPHEESRHWGELPGGPIFIEEHGLQYGVDLREGQKTGFYLDQRDNRLAAARYFAGRRVLDMFCYSGGFGMNAARHGNAAEVICGDTSEKAIALARANADLNGIANMRFQTGDGFQMLSEFAAKGERFGAVVLDPPKFARSRSSVNDALMAYHRLNRLATSIIEPGGILVTCSCSGHVTREDFMHMLAGVAQRSGRGIQVLEQRGASADHPVSVSCLENEYLKCFICRVV